MIALIAGLAHAACTVLSGGTVYLPDGTTAVQSVTLDGDRIVASGTDCIEVDVTGMHVAPGFVEPASQLGLVEVGLESGSKNVDMGGPHPVRAALVASEAYNPRSALIPVARIEGVTSSVIVPQGGQVSGQAAWVDLAGASQADTVKNPSVAMVVNLGGPSFAGALHRFRELLQDVRDYRANKAAWEKAQRRPYVASRLDLEALYPVVDKRLPVLVSVNRASDLEALLPLASEVKLIVRGAAEGWIVADQLADAGVPVVVDPLRYGPGGFGSVHARRDNAKLLARAGVTVLLGTQSSHNARKLRQLAGNAVREGLPHDVAVQAISKNVADAFGMTDYGRIAPGAVANVVVWSGDPLEISSTPVHVFIGGHEVRKQSRQTELFQRYRTLPGSPTPPLSLP